MHAIGLRSPSTPPSITIKCAQLVMIGVAAVDDTDYERQEKILHAKRTWLWRFLDRHYAHIKHIQLEDAHVIPSDICNILATKWAHREDSRLRLECGSFVHLAELSGVRKDISDLVKCIVVLRIKALSSPGTEPLVMPRLHTLRVSKLTPHDVTTTLLSCTNLTELHTSVRHTTDMKVLSWIAPRLISCTLQYVFLKRNAHMGDKAFFQALTRCDNVRVITPHEAMAICALRFVPVARRFSFHIKQLYD